MIKKGKRRLIITIDEKVYHKLNYEASIQNITKSQFVEDAIIDEIRYLEREDETNEI